ncbi:hypothetical protein [Endozoicomonas atrinae]|uniref:hypothetical protein n=1 Tax=Endozoicomonas atrinae TaxID=1333660 RepID=UPI003B00CF18
MAAYYLKTTAIGTYVKSLQINTPLNSNRSKAQVAAEYLNKGAAFLSDKVPPFYLSILGVVLMERLSAGELKADALNNMMSSPALNITTEVREKVVTFARNLYRAEKIDDVSLKPANIATTSMAFSLYIMGSLQLLISQTSNSRNSGLMEQCFSNFTHEIEEGQKNQKNPCSRSVESFIKFIGILSIGMRAFMNGAFEIKDATPDVKIRDMLFSIFGKSFVPLSLMENARYKDDINQKNQEVLLKKCQTKLMLNEPLNEEEQDFMKAIAGESGSHYNKKSWLSKAFTYGTTALSSGVLVTDVTTALLNPQASAKFWSTPNQAGGAVTYSHVYKGAVRPISAALNLMQVMWVSGSSYTKDDVEAFVHIGSRLLLATAPLIMWDMGSTLWDSIAAMIDTAITVGEDSAASRSINKGQLAKQRELAISNLRLQAHATSHEALPVHTGHYLDRLCEGLINRLLVDDDPAPEEIIAPKTNETLTLLRRKGGNTGQAEPKFF